MKNAEHLRTWAVIRLQHLESNMRTIRGSLPDYLRYIAVVKADAYGHGLSAIATRLMRGRADAFAVANLNEAATLDKLGEGWPVMVLSPLLPAERKFLFETKAIPILSSAEEVEAFDALAARYRQVRPVQIKIDTGMGRAGIWHRDTSAIAEALKETRHLQVSGLCTHFPNAESDPDLTLRQRARFLRAMKSLSLHGKDVWIHADNSAGLESFPSDGPFNAARVGLLQFGVQPHAGSLLRNLGVQPVLSLHSRVALVKELPAGVGISYGQTCRLRRRTRVAVLAGGYGDGIPTSLSNRGEVLIRGVSCPVLGRVTMDQTVVDVSTLPRVATGDIGTWIGQDGKARITTEEFAETAGRIPWEILTGLTARVNRVYEGR